MNNITEKEKFAIFKTSNNNLYGISITKIKAFIIAKEITINQISTNYKIVKGLGTIRGEAITIINLDEWLGNKVLSNEEYSLIILCQFNNKKIGFLVKEIINITEKETYELLDNVSNSNKIQYLTYTNNKELCTIFNMERILLDIGLNIGV